MVKLLRNFLVFIGATIFGIVMRSWSVTDYREVVRARNNVIQNSDYPPGTNELQIQVEHPIPTLHIAGTQKASTSSLAVYMLYELGMCFPEDRDFDGSNKEPHFFDWQNQYDKGLEQYRELYRHCKHTNVIVDGTPETMLYPERVKKIYDEQGIADRVKFIFILREPVSREISWYNHRLRYAESESPPSWTKHVIANDGIGFKSFLETMQATVFVNFEFEQFQYLYGVYVHFLERWVANFDRSQMLILSYDELRQDTESLLRRVHEFINVPVTNKLELQRTNADTQRRDPPPCADQLQLHEKFEPYNQALYQWLNDHPGPSMEQRPFPEFKVNCRQD